MKAWKDKDVERLIKDSRFQDPAHKNDLRGRLFDEAVALDPDDLGMVTGGSALPEQEHWEVWPEPEKDGK